MSQYGDGSRLLDNDGYRKLVEFSYTFEPIRIMYAEQLDGSIYEKNPSNPKKFIQKVSQLFLVPLGMLNNILKV